MEQLKETIAQNITRLRCAANLTQLDLGERLNYSDKAVSKWERAQSIPDVYVLKQIADLFGVTVDYLLCEHSEEENVPDAPPTEQVIRRRRDTRRTIAAISILGVFSLATLIFSVMYLFGNPQWLIFVYACPVAVLVWLILNAIWGSGMNTLLLTSLLLWTIIAAVYLSLLPKNPWQLFLIGIFPQIIIFACFKFAKKQ